MFSQDELTLNRNGQLASSQTQRVHSLIGKRLLLNMTVFVVLALLFIGLGIFLSFLPPRSSGNAAFVPLLLLGGIGLLMLVGLLKFGWDWWQVQQDTREGRVVQGSGLVEWKGSSYRATVEGRQLQFVTALAPSQYQFYYLPRSGYIVFAEQVGYTDLRQSLQTVLGQAFKFDPNDLALNRQGELSAGQAAGLWRDVWVWVTVGVVLLGGLTLIPIIFMFTSRSRRVEWEPILIFVGVAVLIGGLFAYMAWRLWRDISERRVLYAEGGLTKYMRRSNKSTKYYLVVAGQRFSVGVPQYNAAIEGKAYRFYFMPRAKTIVGVEVL